MFAAHPTSLVDKVLVVLRYTEAEKVLETIREHHADKKKKKRQLQLCSVWFTVEHVYRWTLKDNTTDSFY